MKKTLIIFFALFLAAVSHAKPIDSFQCSGHSGSKHKFDVKIFRNLKAEIDIDDSGKPVQYSLIQDRSERIELSVELQDKIAAEKRAAGIKETDNVLTFFTVPVQGQFRVESFDHLESFMIFVNRTQPAKSFLQTNAADVRLNCQPSFK